MQHPAQLLICHEHIGARESDKQDRFQWCQLAAHVWCKDCGFYICEMHLNTRHITHVTSLVGDPPALEPVERRDGVERRKVR